MSISLSRLTKRYGDDASSTTSPSRSPKVTHRGSRTSGSGKSTLLNLISGLERPTKVGSSSRATTSPTSIRGTATSAFAFSATRRFAT